MTLAYSVSVWSESMRKVTQSLSSWQCWLFKPSQLLAIGIHSCSSDLWRSVHSSLNSSSGERHLLALAQQCPSDPRWAASTNVPSGNRRSSRSALIIVACPLGKQNKKTFTPTGSFPFPNDGEHFAVHCPSGLFVLVHWQSILCQIKHERSEAF